MSTREHGTPSCYVMGCRRPECRQANIDENRANREWRRSQRRLVDGRLVHPDPRVKHGTAGGYGYWGCRCPECAAHRASRP